MIVPSKHIHAENALIGVGADVLHSLQRPKTVSILFNEVQKKRAQSNQTRIHFDWFLLALDFLFAIGAVDFEQDLIRKQMK